MFGITLTEANKVVIAAGITVTGSLVVALITLSWNRYSSQRDRRRQLYADAYKSALAWKEMLYRVRRRSGKPDEGYKIVERFHEIQEQIDFYEGWLGSESLWLGRAYGKFVNDLKTSTSGPIQKAWKEEIRDPSEATHPKDEHPQTAPYSQAFLRDIRRWSSFWQVPKLLVIWRNRRWFRSREK